MARITVEDCLEKIPNRFSLCIVTAMRTQELMSGQRSLIEDERSNKEIVTALREIAAGRILMDSRRFDENTQAAVQLQRADDTLPPSAP